MKISNLSTSELLAKARFYASRAVPYLSRSLWEMRFIETDEVDTCAVDDHWRVYVNPDYIRKCAEQGTLVGELFHECLHPTLRHRQRAAAIHAEEHRRWNACGDAELDQHIEAAGVQLVDKRVRPQDLGGAPGMTAEELYRLPNRGKAGRCSGGSGSCTEAHPCEGKHKNAPGISETRADLVRAAVAHDIRQHAAIRGRGSVPFGLLRWAEEWNDPAPVPWHELTAARIQYSIDSRKGPSPSYARPARREHPAGFILPVYRLPVPTIALVLDTSASMDEDEIGQALAVVFDATQALGRVWVVSCDARATEPVEIRHIDDLREHLQGGGGTDMRVGIERALEIQPDAIVVVTDGETPWPDEEPEVPMTVVLTEKSCVPPPVWADVIEIPHETAKVGTP